jgi:hypothetical protein
MQLSRLMAHAREWPPRLCKQASLEQVTTKLDQYVALLGALDSFGDDLLAHVVTQIDHRAHDLALGRSLVDVAHERHVELDELRLELREASKPSIACAQVVERNPEAKLA